MDWHNFQTEVGNGIKKSFRTSSCTWLQDLVLWTGLDRDILETEPTGQWVEDTLCISPLEKPYSPLVPGRCWPMAGDRGHVTIQLFKAARVNHITIGHIAKVQSPTRDNPSAPRDMTIYGLNLMSGEEKLLGSFTYDQRGPSFQTFTLPRVHPETFQHVRIHVDSNYGNKDCTCLYNIQVHGEAPASD